MAALRESEERYRTLVEHTFDFVVETTPDGRFLFVSREYTEALGYQPEELIGTDAFALMHPDDIRMAEQAFVRGVAARSTDSAVFRYRHKNGEWRWFESAGRPYVAANGSLRVIICSRDVTERKRVEEALEEQLRVSAALARVGGEMIALVATREILDRLCELTVQELGSEVSYALLLEARGEPLRIAAGWDAAQGRLDAAALTSSTVRDELAELTGAAVARGAGAVPLSSGVAARLELAQGLGVAMLRGQSVIGLLVAGFRDPGATFSEGQRRIAQGMAHYASLALENARLLERAESASRLKSDFVSTISHELRTPLHIILGYNDLLLTGEFGEVCAAQKEVLRRVRRSAGDLGELIDATLDVARLDTGRMPVSLSAFEIGSVFTELRDGLADSIERSGLEFEWSIERGLPSLHSDATKLKFVLRNLISNAVKFTERGSVHIHACGCDDGLQISVADTGIGIEPSSLPFIFDRFRQAETTPMRARQGVGLGLYIVWRMLELVGGRITVESEVGRGSIFRVWVPYERPPAARDRLDPPRFADDGSPT